jgi:hypothetical protein
MHMKADGFGQKRARLNAILLSVSLTTDGPDMGKPEKAGKIGQRAPRVTGTNDVFCPEAMVILNLVKNHGEGIPIEDKGSQSPPLLARR